jgi:hypothetical protein
MTVAERGLLSMSTATLSWRSKPTPGLRTCPSGGRWRGGGGSGPTLAPFVPIFVAGSCGAGCYRRCTKIGV